ncbi:hypothetical protein ACIBHY_47200 [Nonomuraea sp. NPDC050547]|uniref:hypothetical protein n=1 Tax=Nonomuraea sp. NPDC050547 TaxID=3364368 RepID=UPI0037B5C210
MRPDIQRLAAAAALVSLFGITGCSGDPEKPGLDEAAKLLVADGEKLLDSQDMRSVGSAAVTERADRDGEVGCLKGQVQRFFRAQGDLKGPPYKQSPGSVAGLLASWLRLRSYSSIVDDLDLRDENLGTAVLQHSTTGVTFAITIRNGQKPHIMIVGKTSCYERGA